MLAVVVDGARAHHPRLLAEVRPAGRLRGNTPALYNFTALWARSRARSCCGSLILAATRRRSRGEFRKRLDDPLVGWALLVMFVVSAFFFVLMLRPGQPVQARRRRPPASTARARTRCCRTTRSMAFHPPILYLGYVGFTVPFAFAIAALVTGRFGEGWLVETRRWTLFAWGFLTVGIVLGAWWSYEVLGWGGYWAWDPVENASLPAVAHRHRLHPLGDGAGAARDAARLEPVACSSPRSPDDPRHVPHPLGRDRLACTRSATADRAVAARRSSALIVVVSLGADRLARRPAAVARARSTRRCSREGAFLANNLLFAVFAFVVLLGTVFPLIVEALAGPADLGGRAVLRPHGRCRSGSRCCS